MSITAYSLLSYLIGSFNTSCFVSRRRGFDIRKRGTGNAGATNVMFVMGFRIALLVMLVDVLKAYLAVWVAKRLWKGTLIPAILAGIGCILGHVFPLYFGFRGGKGSACLAGTILALTPVLFLVEVVLLFGLGFLLDKGGILPMAAAASYPVLFFFTTELVVESLLLAAVIPLFWVKHRENAQWRRQGRESSFRKVISGQLDDCVERTSDLVENSEK